MGAAEIFSVISCSNPLPELVFLHMETQHKTKCMKEHNVRVNQAVQVSDCAAE